VELLLQAGVNPLQKDRLGKTPIHWVSDRLNFMRAAIYSRRLQFADEEEQEEIRNKIIFELQKMINELSNWANNVNVTSQDKEYVIRIRILCNS
jgi:hypothetical protein